MVPLRGPSKGGQVMPMVAMTQWERGDHVSTRHLEIHLLSFSLSSSLFHVCVCVCVHAVYLSVCLSGLASLAFG